MTHAQPLRIAMMLESDGPGGAEMMILRLSQQLRDRGHTVIPVGPADGCGWLADLFRAEGFAPQVFRMRHAMDPKCVVGLVQLFREHGIDAVHSHEFTMAVYGAAATRVLGLPHVITMHGGVNPCGTRRRRVALRWAMRSADRTVMVARATQRQFASRLGIDEARLTVVPNGVPIRSGDADRVRDEFHIQPDDCVLLAVGNLERHKGHRVLLDALSRLSRNRERLKWKLIIAGGRGGDQQEALQEFIEEQDWEDCVHIVANRDDIPDLLALADIFVMPSLWEGLPMALLEAMIAKKAIVASATAGIPEAIKHGKEGLLVTPGEIDALAGALRDLILDPVRRQTLGEAAGLRAEQEFTVNVMTDRYESMYAHAAVARQNGNGRRHE
ncbi:MAG: glycosyltransferase family 4 protein [Gemmatimonadaceae bacterium]